MKIFIATTVLIIFYCGAVFAQSSEMAHDAHRFVNNSSALSHVNSAMQDKNIYSMIKISLRPFSEMNEHERAIIAHSFMNNSSSSAHQKMIEEHKKMLAVSELNSETSSFNNLNPGEKAALVHESVNNAGAEAHQIQARKLRGMVESQEQ